jgi:hypothetical protein
MTADANNNDSGQRCFAEETSAGDLRDDGGGGACFDARLSSQNEINEIKFGARSNNAIGDDGMKNIVL